MPDRTRPVAGTGSFWRFAVGGTASITGRAGGDLAVHLPN
jgi:hypothetical protein